MTTMTAWLDPSLPSRLPSDAVRLWHGLVHMMRYWLTRTHARLAAVAFSKVLLNNLPCCDMYERSYMHRAPISHIAVCAKTDFVITAR